MTTRVSDRSELRQIAKDAFLYALKSVAPEQLVMSAVSLDKTGKKLSVGGNEFDIEKTPSIVIIGAGKATQELVSGILQVFSECKVENIKIRVQANYPKGQSIHTKLPKLSCATVSLLEASHPISDEYTVSATNEQIKLLYDSEPGTLAIVLMSGGGSALYETTESFGNAKASPITLNDLQLANKVLIESGANITEINIVRKHISQVKGGRTAQHAIQSGRIAKLIGLYLSDVVGNNLSSVASGPTCPDVSTFEDCHAILSKYGIREKMPSAIVKHLDKALHETPKPDDPLFTSGRVFNVLIGSADTSAQAASQYLEPLGFVNDIFTNQMEGEASTYGSNLISLIESRRNQQHNKLALIGTGEFTVTIKGSGVGGRNQEMLLAFMRSLAKNGEALNDINFAVLGCAFDGIEGNSPATGAIVDTTSLDRLSAVLSSSPSSESSNVTELIDRALANNASYDIFKMIDDAVVTGYTGTNVNDLLLVLLERSDKKQ